MDQNEGYKQIPMEITRVVKLRSMIVQQGCAPEKKTPQAKDGDQSLTKYTHKYFCGAITLK